MPVPRRNVLTGPAESSPYNRSWSAQPKRDRMAPCPGACRETLDQAPQPSLRAQGKEPSAPRHPSSNCWQGNAGCDGAGAPRAPAWHSCGRSLTHKTGKTSFLLTTGPLLPAGQGTASYGSHMHGNVILRYNFGSWSEQKGAGSWGSAMLPARRRMLRGG